MAPDLNSHKIVIVEDEGLIAADLEARLKMAGYAVQGTADSANRALVLVQQTSPDLVLMDIRLKGKVDGIETADRIRRHYDIPVLYLTAYEDAETLDRAGRSQAFGYLRKPIATAGLKGAIEIAIAKHRHEREIRKQRDWAIASFASVPDFVFVTDREGRVTYLNPKAEQLTGATADQAMGLSCWELLRLHYQQSGERVHDFIPIAMLEGRPVSLPKGICQSTNGCLERAIAGIVAPRWRDGHMEGALITLADVSGTLFDDEQARQDGKQDALKRLADGMIRKLRHPAETLEDGTSSAVPAASDQLTDCLASFFNTPVLHLGRVDLNKHLHRVEHAWREIEPRLAVAFELEEATVQADSWQLTRALVSILLHARSRAKLSHPLSLVLSASDLAQMKHAARIRISYATEEDAAAIEQMFEPSWNGPTQDLQGAYQLLKKMGAVVSAHLEHGDRAVLDLYFPRVTAEAAGAGLPEIAEPAILLVDSNAEVRCMLVSHFSANGDKMVAAAGCDEALLLAELYPGAIPLVIANLPHEHPSRVIFSEKMAILRPRAEIRLMCGYKEPRQATAGERLDFTSERQITKWELLEWARQSVCNADSEAKL